MKVKATPDSALYETIHSQPGAMRSVMEVADEELSTASEMLLTARRVFLVGTGTSAHAAVVGEHLLRAVGIDAHATTNFDFVNYGRGIGTDDAVVAISHRGGKLYGRLAIERAIESSTPVVGITRLGSPMQGAEVLIPTVENERSATHTASYTSALMVLALLAFRLEEQSGIRPGELQGAVERLPDHVASLLAREDEVRPVAEALAARGRLVVTGAGPNAATACEGALKIKESSYLVAEGFDLETMLHGGLQAIEAGDVAAVVAAKGPASDRAADLVGALRIIGARIFLIGDEKATHEFPTDEIKAEGGTVFSYPHVPEPLSPALAVVPLQLLATFTAEARGTNPDLFRANELPYKQANESYTL